MMYENKTNEIDTIIITSDKDIQLLNKIMRFKSKTLAKFNRKYYLKITYKNNSYVEFSGNGKFLRDSIVYKIPEKFQLEYLHFINSRLPSYLQQY